VTDIQDYSVRVYDRAGNYKLRIGQQGGGPGEFQRPVGAYFAWNGELVVPDPMNQRTSFFSTDGNFLRSEPMGTNGMVRISGVQIPTSRGEYIRPLSGSGGIMMMRMVGEGSGRPQLPDDPTERIEVVNDKGEQVRAFGQQAEHEDARVARMLNRSVIAWNGKNEVALGLRYSNEIRIFDYATGALKQFVTRGLAFNPVEPKTDMVRQTSPDGMNVTVRLMEIGDAVTLSMAYDSEGRLWAITSILDQGDTEEREEDGEYENMVRLEAFSPDGELLATITLEEPANRIYFDAEGDMWLLDTDYLASIRRFEVVWP
jgi:WD40 repeat protein